MNTSEMYQYQGIIFDMDGVLFDSMPLLIQSACDLLKEYGIILNQNMETLKKLAGTSHDSFRSMIDTTFNAPVDWNSFYKRWEETVLDKSDTVSRIPGVLALLITLHNRNIKLGLATSSQRNLVNKLFQHHQFMFPLFDVIVCSDDIKQSKPHPEIFLTAAEKLYLLPEHCVVIEDSLIGILAAKNAGMTTIAITTSFDKKELHMADHVISSYYEIL